MPQTTNAIPQSCARIRIAVDSACATWFDISGEANSVVVPEQTKVVADEYTFDGDGAISEVGKVQPVDIPVRIVYTEIGTEGYNRVRAVFEQGACEGKLCLEWSPGGGDVGDFLFRTNFAPVTGFQWPPVDAAAGGPVMCTFTVHASTVTQSIATS